jgi:RimJ/RimL family protein N-acetyltransferase
MTRNDPRNLLPDKIVSERLVLRPPMRGDVPVMAKLADNRKIFQVLARLPHPYTRADAIAFVEIFAQRADQRVYAITRRDGDYMGTVGFHLAPCEAPEIGYWLGEPFWSRGYMGEAVKALLEAAWTTGQFPRIRASALKTNIGSLKILENNGFVRTGFHISDQGHNTGETVIDLMLEVRP